MGERDELSTMCGDLGSLVESVHPELGWFLLTNFALLMFQPRFQVPVPSLAQRGCPVYLDPFLLDSCV